MNLIFWSCARSLHQKETKYFSSKRYYSSTIEETMVHPYLSITQPHFEGCTYLVTALHPGYFKGGPASSNDDHSCLAWQSERKIVEELNLLNIKIPLARKLSSCFKILTAVRETNCSWFCNKQHTRTYRTKLRHHQEELSAFKYFSPQWLGRRPQLDPSSEV